MRTLLQAAWVPGGLGTGAGRVPTLQEDSDSSADSGSETDDSVDTQSETKVVALPLVTKGMGAQRGAIASTDWHPSEL